MGRVVGVGREERGSGGGIYTASEARSRSSRSRVLQQAASAPGVAFRGAVVSCLDAIVWSGMQVSRARSPAVPSRSLVLSWGCPPTEQD